MEWRDRFAGKIRSVFGEPQPELSGEGGNSANLREETAEYEWFIALSELEAGDNLPHGAGHLATLLGYDPGRKEWIELLERYLEAADGDPESLIPREEQLYASTEAMRAYIWHKQGKLAEAVELLVDVADADPGGNYMEDWALNWLEPQGAVEFLPDDFLYRLFSTIWTRFPEAKHSPAPRLRDLRRWVALMQRVGSQLGEDDSTMMLRLGVLRKAGLLDQALAAANQAIAKSPSWHVLTAKGLILRYQAQPDEAEQAFEQALELDPEDISARLEAGDALLDFDIWESAQPWYDSVLEREPEHPWAPPSSIYCRWRQSDDDQDLDQLIEVLKQGNDRARYLVYDDILGGLVVPADASAGFLEQTRDEVLEGDDAPGGPTPMGVSCLEAPSNYLAFDLEMESLQHDMTLSVGVSRVPHPDPRVPCGEVKHLLWKYDGTDAEPALPPPRPEVSQQIAELADLPYDEPRIWAAASFVAEQLGPEAAQEILATMVHPPPIPDQIGALTWLPRVQHAAAYVLAWLDNGWDGSVRREALLSALHGPSDWTTNAAIEALSKIGIEEPALAPEIHEEFQRRADNIPDYGHCCWAKLLFECWLQLPHLYDSERERLEAKVAEFDLDDNEEQE